MFGRKKTKMKFQVKLIEFGPIPAHLTSMPFGISWIRGKQLKGKSQQTQVINNYANFGEELFTFVGTVIQDRSGSVKHKGMTFFAEGFFSPTDMKRFGEFKVELADVFNAKQAQRLQIPIEKSTLLTGVTLKIDIVCFDPGSPLVFIPTAETIHHELDDEEESIKSTVTEATVGGLKSGVYGGLSSEEEKKLAQLAQNQPKQPPQTSTISLSSQLPANPEITPSPDPSLQLEIDRLKSEIADLEEESDKWRKSFDLGKIAQRKQTEEIEGLKEQLESTKNEFEKIQLKIALQTAELAKSTQRIVELEGELETSRNSRDDSLNEEKTRMSLDQARLDKERSKMEEMEKKLREEAERMREEKLAHDSEVDAKEKGIRERNDELDQLREEITIQRAQLEEEQAKLRKDEQLLQQRADETLARTREALEQRELSLAAKETELAGKESSIREELERTRTEFQTLQNRMRENEEQLTSTNNELAALKNLNQTQTSTLDEQKATIAHLNTSLSTNSSELAHSQNLVAELEQSLESSRRKLEKSELIREMLEQAAEISKSTDAEEHVQQTEAALMKLKTEFKQLQNQLEDEKKSTAKKERELDTLREKIGVVEAQAEQTELKHTSVSTELETLKIAHSSIQNTLSEVEAKNTELEQETNKLREEQKTLNDTLATVSAERQEAETQMKAMKDELLSANTSLNAVQAEKLALEEQLNATRQELDLSNKTLAEIRSEKDALTSQVSELEASVQSIELERATADQLQTQLNTLTNTLKQKEREFVEKERELAEKEKTRTKIEQSNAQLIEQLAVLSTLNERMVEKETEIKALREEVKSERKMKEDALANVDEVTQELSKVKSEHSKLSAQISVPSSTSPTPIAQPLPIRHLQPAPSFPPPSPSPQMGMHTSGPLPTMPGKSKKQQLGLFGRKHVKQKIQIRFIEFGPLPPTLASFQLFVEWRRGRKLRGSTAIGVNTTFCSFGGELLTFVGTMITDKNNHVKEKPMDFSIFAKLGDNEKKLVGKGSIDLGNVFLARKTVRCNVEMDDKRIVSDAVLKLDCVCVGPDKEDVFKAEEGVISRVLDDDEETVLDEAVDVDEKVEWMDAADLQRMAEASPDAEQNESDSRAHLNVTGDIGEMEGLTGSQLEEWTEQAERWRRIQKEYEESQETLLNKFGQQENEREKEREEAAEIKRKFDSLETEHSELLEQMEEKEQEAAELQAALDALKEAHLNTKELFNEVQTELETLKQERVSEIAIVPRLLSQKLLPVQALLLLSNLPRHYIRLDQPVKQSLQFSVKRRVSDGVSGILLFVEKARVSSSAVFNVTHIPCHSVLLLAIIDHLNRIHLTSLASDSSDQLPQPSTLTPDVLFTILAGRVFTAFHDRDKIAQLMYWSQTVFLLIRFFHAEMEQEDGARNDFIVAVVSQLQRMFEMIVHKMSMTLMKQTAHFVDESIVTSIDVSFLTVPQQSIQKGHVQESPTPQIRPRVISLPSLVAAYSSFIALLTQSFPNSKQSSFIVTTVILHTTQLFVSRLVAILTEPRPGLFSTRTSLQVNTFTGEFAHWIETTLPLLSPTDLRETSRALFSRLNEYAAMMNTPPEKIVDAEQRRSICPSFTITQIVNLYLAATDVNQTIVQKMVLACEKEGRSLRDDSKSRVAPQPPSSNNILEQSSITPSKVEQDEDDPRSEPFLEHLVEKMTSLSVDGPHNTLRTPELSDSILILQHLTPDNGTELFESFFSE
ncbi:hypothetical protein BLNAU_11705 [Blattamonas nauphoetae]|uniref:C2 NT-type domain-containing protein n=1 Tax=Blattamonas nauphoetae TaxID=2049346 RepID=A0ABQ9XNT4_9EUKA|nr:hypothetical protein BLNAU_11705 [Blattamonas nauphoetae]